MIEDCRKTGENSLINDKLKKIVLALLVSFFFIIIISFWKKITVTVSSIFYCTASSPPKIWPRLPESHSGH